MAALIPLICAASAQDPAEVSMRLDVVAWGDPIGGLSFKSPQGDGKITARAFTYSEPVQYRGPRLLEIHQTGSGKIAQAELPGTPEDEEHRSIPLPVAEPKASDEGPPISAELARRREESPTLVSLALLPANSRRATILLAPAAQETYRAYVIDDDPAKLPSGSVRVHNLAPLDILMQFSDGTRRELKPGETMNVKAPGGSTAYRLAYRAGAEWVVQENNMIPVPEDRQTQFVVLKSDNRFFLSADGATGGYLQSVTLTRAPER
ncbi:MAG: hypothetical protein ACO3JG_00860 [Luteolibacter sp.]